MALDRTLGVKMQIVLGICRHSNKPNIQIQTIRYFSAFGLFETPCSYSCVQEGNRALVKLIAYWKQEQIKEHKRAILLVRIKTTDVGLILL